MTFSNLMSLFYGGMIDMFSVTSTTSNTSMVYIFENGKWVSHGNCDAWDSMPERLFTKYAQVFCDNNCQNPVGIIGDRVFDYHVIDNASDDTSTSVNTVNTDVKDLIDEIRALREQNEMLFKAFGSFAAMFEQHCDEIKCSNAICIKEVQEASEAARMAASRIVNGY